jgi:hypothetical protein
MKTAVKNGRLLLYYILLNYGKENKMANIDDRDLYQILIAEFRYAVKRDNHLAPDTCAQHIKTYLPEMNKQWRAHTARQLSEEIIDERLWASKWMDPEFMFKNDADSFLSTEPKKQLNEDYLWEDLLIFLTNYLEGLPYNSDRYMEYIRGRMTYSEGIDYYSKELAEKIRNNLCNE